jgi:hypothetical protein
MIVLLVNQWEIFTKLTLKEKSLTKKKYSIRNFFFIIIHSVLEIIVLVLNLN